MEHDIATIRQMIRKGGETRLEMESKTETRGKRYKEKQELIH